MADERRTREPTREREVIVTDSNGGRSGLAGVVAAIIGIAAIIVLVVLLFDLLGGSGGTDEVDVPEVDVPSEVDVNVNDGEGGGE